MSHSHRDDNQLTDVEVKETPAVAPVQPVQPVTNTEAAQRAADRRKEEGASEQDMQRQFTGELPRPERGGGDETVVLGGAADGDDDPDAMLRARWVVLRGAPAPRAKHYEDETSWAAPPHLEMFGASLALTDTAWTADGEPDAATLPAHGMTWTR